MADIVINWTIEVTEDYSVTVSEADALERWKTTDPIVIAAIIERNVDGFLPGKETEEACMSAIVNERELDSVDKV